MLAASHTASPSIPTTALRGSVAELCLQKGGPHFPPLPELPADGSQQGMLPRRPPLPFPGEAQGHWLANAVD